MKVVVAGTKENVIKVTGAVMVMVVVVVVVGGRGRGGGQGQSGGLRRKS